MTKVSQIRGDVDLASQRWDPRAPGATEKLVRKLEGLRNRGSVVQSFVDLMYDMSGEAMDTHSLIAGRDQDDIDDGFEAVLSFLRSLGKPGIDLARSLRLKNG